MDMYGDTKSSDQIGLFKSQMGVRFWQASACSGFAVLMLLCLSVLFGQFLTPYSLELFPMSRAGALCVFASTVCLSWILILKCFKSKYEMNSNVTKPEVIMAMIGMFAFHVAIWIAVVFYSLNHLPINWMSNVLFVNLAFFSSYQMALTTNFRWQVSKIDFKKTIKGVIRSLIWSGALAYALCVLFCSFLPMFRIAHLLDLVLALRATFLCFYVAFVVQIAVRVTIQFITMFAMQPITMPLISQASSSTLNLMASIASKDDMLTEFALRQLKELVRTSQNARQTIFSLSQPGKKPRNWMTIYELCSTVINGTYEMLQVNTSLMETHFGTDRKDNLARFGMNLRPANTPTIRPMARRQFELDQTSQSSSVESFKLNQSKNRLLQPPQLNPRVRHAKEMDQKGFSAKLSLIPGYVYFEHWWKKFSSAYLIQEPRISSYYLKLTEYCLDTLSVLAALSLHEDRYGIVQPHLSSIISMFLRLELAIDLYIRSTSNNKAEAVIRKNLHDLEDVLHHSVGQIYVNFKPHIDSLDLDESERKVLDNLTMGVQN